MSQDGRDLSSYGGLANGLNDEILVSAGTNMITKLQTQKKDPSRVSVYIDGVYAFGLPKAVAVKHMLRKGMVLSIAAQDALATEAQLVKAKGVALEYLSYRPRTEHELRQRLLKAFPEGLVVQVIERFRELRYIDDENYAKCYARSRLHSKARGPRRIRTELKQRGVSEDHIEWALEHLADTESFSEVIFKKAERRWQKLAKEPSKGARRNKFLQYLTRQGFDMGFGRELMASLEEQDRAQEGDDDVYREADEAVQAEATHEEVADEAPTIDSFLPYAEKRWRVLSSESNEQIRKRKLTDGLRRKRASFDQIREILSYLQAQDAAEQEELAAQEPELSDEVEEIEEDPLAAIRPLAEKRWGRLVCNESNKAKRKKKFVDFLLRRGVSYSQARDLLEELQAYE